MVRSLKAVALLAIVSGAVVAADLKSGPQAGEKVPGPFHPLNINGEDAGRKECLYCRHGDSPVAAVFARTADDANLKKLISELDAATDRNQKVEMGSFVVFLSDEKAFEGKLKEQAEKAKYKQVTIALDSADGPAKYNISKDADITVLLYKDRVVVANYTFAKGKLGEKDVEKIVADIAKIVK
jgi:hypothetical protein